MGFGIDIGGAIKSAVKSAGDAVSGAAHKVEDGVKSIESKAKSAWDKITDGFDHGPKGQLVESKPKGGSGTRFA
ncbi:MAG TPA: hypothetical protein VFA20_35215 [Myxococcaceae bacterium]|nr:hypothetical protein [Myxococcaceae bacterium]